jgi:hypothetical protein
MPNKTLFIVAALAGLLGCQSRENDLIENVLPVGDCFYDARKTIETFTRVEGVVVLTKVGSETEATIHKSTTNGMPFCACNLPSSFFQDSLRIEFSGEQKQIYPHERWKCLPLVLTSIALIPGKGSL